MLRIQALQALVLALRCGALAFVREPFSLIRRQLAVIGNAVTFVGNAVPDIRRVLPVGEVGLTPCQATSIANARFDDASGIGIFFTDHDSTVVPRSWQDYPLGVRR